MPWFKVDDQFHASRKLNSIPKRHRLQAAGLWAIAGSWVSGQETDGFVPDYMIQVWGPTQKTIDALVESGLWIRENNGFRFYSWLDYNPSKEDSDAKRAASKERMRKSRERFRRQLEDESSNDSRESAGQSAVNESVALQHPSATNQALQRPDPTRPDPTRTSKEVPSSRDTTAKADGANKPAKKNHPIPEDWMPKQSTIDKMRTERPDLNLEAEHQNFMDYWQSITGAKARKADWDKTWLVWMRKQHQNAPRQKAPTNTTEAWLGTTNQPPIIDAEPQKEIAW